MASNVLIVPCVREIDLTIALSIYLYVSILLFQSLTRAQGAFSTVLVCGLWAVWAGQFVQGSGGVVARSLF